MDTNMFVELTVINGNYPWDLLMLADPSKSAIEKYLYDSDCYIARCNEVVIGVAVIKSQDSEVYELMNIAVFPAYQNRGYGSQILNSLIEILKNKQANVLEVGTGSFGYQLKFYQKFGFRVDQIKTNFFLDNYSEPIFEDGLQHKDMLILRLTL
ncbi:GNAT family N-acetyltransferase [Olivibacter jilunii]|uniref:GNAT family N-acetyltransferase n=1 Tax=Olivibacter jilunii TaxID=985016 RepID=UPI003F1570FD